MLNGKWMNARADIEKIHIWTPMTWIEILWKLEWCGSVENKSTYLFTFRKRFTAPEIINVMSYGRMFFSKKRGQLKYKATIFLSSLFADSTLKMKIKLSFSLYCKGETVIIKRDLPTFRSQHMPSKELVNDKNIFQLFVKLFINIDFIHCIYPQ